MSNFPLELTAFVKDHKFQVRGKERLDQAVKLARDGEYLLTIERAHATRSQQANRYYWGVVIDHLSEYSGHTPEECHEYCKQRFLPKRLAVKGKNGTLDDNIVIGGTTTKLNTIQFGEYVRDIRVWMLDDLGIEVPDPHEYGPEASKQPAESAPRWWLVTDIEKGHAVAYHSFCSSCWPDNAVENGAKFSWGWVRVHPIQNLNPDEECCVCEKTAAQRDAVS